MLASGMTQDEILQEYPYLEKADFSAVYAYASQAGRERPLPLKLLFDANLCPKLVGRLAHLFPDSVHVFEIGLERLTSDR